MTASLQGGKKKRYASTLFPTQKKEYISREGDD